jgi:hypothetical protein
MVVKFHRMPEAAVRGGDDPEMREAIDRLQRAFVDVRRPINNRHQLKVSANLSYYPTTGRITPDGEPALPQTGLDALIDLLIEQGLAKRK